MKRILIGMIAVMVAMPVFAEDTPAVGDKTTTSQPYVKTQVDLKQGLIPAAGTNSALGETVVTYTSNGEGEIGERGIYTGGTYDASTDADKLITASALNTAFTTLPTTDTTTLECANPGTCTLWTIVDQTAYGESITLPAGYTRLAYIESNGTQYINTGVSGAATWNITAQSDSFSGSTNHVLVARNSSGQTWFGAIATTGKWGAGATAGAYTSVPYTTKANITAIFTSTSLSGTVNGENYNRTGTATDVWNDYVLLAYNNNYFFTGKLYSAKCIQNGTLVRDMVPVKNASNVVGMYDIVNNRFYQNNGNGDFIAGPAVN